MKGLISTAFYPRLSAKNANNSPSKSTENTAWKTAIMPETAVTTVAKRCYGMHFFSPRKAGNYRNQLVFTHTSLIEKLVVSNTGVGFTGFYHTVQDVLPVVPLIQQNIVLLRTFRNGRKSNRVHSLP